MPAPALAADKPAFELALDIDQDGTMDRAVVMQEDGGPADLYFYLATGEEKPDPARSPTSSRRP